MIVHTHVMAEKRNPLGPTGETVRANVRRLREAQNLGYTKLARILEEIGRPIPELGLRRIESGDRRVDADDLVALALALKVPPIALLLPDMPGTDEPGAKVPVTGVKSPVFKGELWIWLKADTIAGPPSWAAVSRPMFEANGVPAWEWAKWMMDTDGDD
jgi:transcriptional regulator with XRE-family HTH domain